MTARSALGRAAGALVGAISLGCAVAAVTSQGGRFSPFLDILTHFAPFYLAGGLVALGLALLWRGWTGPGKLIVVCTALVAVAGSGALMAPEYLAARAQTSRAGPGDLKIIEFNAWAGNRTPQAVVAWVRAEKPDILVLIEGARLPAALERLGYHRRCRGCVATFISRAEFVDSNAPGRRGIVDHPPVPTATFADSDGPFTVIAVHRDWPEELASNDAQRGRLKALVDHYGRDRTIVVGDFNSTPWSFTLRREDAELGLLRRTRALFSWPAERVSHNRLPQIAPFLPIDHVYAGRMWRTVSVRRGPRLGSDHFPIVVVLARVAAPSGQAPKPADPKSPIAAAAGG